MKIINDKYNRYPKNVVCSNCESEIQLEDGKDVIVHKSVVGPFFVYEEQPYVHQWMCPLCKTFNKINF